MWSSWLFYALYKVKSTSREKNPMPFQLCTNESILVIVNIILPPVSMLLARPNFKGQGFYFFLCSYIIFNWPIWWKASRVPKLNNIRFICCDAPNSNHQKNILYIIQHLASLWYKLHGPVVKAGIVSPKSQLVLWFLAFIWFLFTRVDEQHWCVSFYVTNKSCHIKFARRKWGLSVVSHISVEH